MKYQHLTIEEREKIQLMLWQKQSVRTMARELNRNSASEFAVRKNNLQALKNFGEITERKKRAKYPLFDEVRFAKRTRSSEFC